MGIEQELAHVASQRETFLTVGIFDGVHVGHCHLVKRLNQRAQEKGLLSGVVTFNPHPQLVLQPHSRLPWLIGLEDRIKYLRRLGIDLVVVLSFTPEMARLDAREFVVLLKKYLKMSGLIIGPDFALGKGRGGDANLLAALGQEMEFSTEIASPFRVEGEIVSSSLIRQTLDQGDVIKVRKLMGRYFTLRAKVISTDKRGQTLGFPTANLNIRSGQALPNRGVYGTITCVNNKRFASATNVGARPTFGGGEETVETHLLDYHGDLYGKELRVKFVRKLRDEKHFASPEELKTQIKKDVERVRILITRELK
ncbi:MAG: bifunctional riboflavin kinase/FAD synthetase [Dehalococcoidia bacterium]|nr:bifunctional riboflavin kinase/FAD synthetase [Dehalococcoidia bacterium]